VKGWVDKKGGDRVDGWLLSRRRKEIDIGLYFWIFHSVWYTPERKLVDVTQDETYKDANFSTFWPDNERKVNFVEGYSYNNLVIFNSEDTVNHYKQHYASTVHNEQYDVGEAYWTEGMHRIAVKFDTFNGKSRWIHDSLSKNRELLKEKYGGVIVKDEHGELTEWPKGEPPPKALLEFAAG